MANFEFDFDPDCLEIFLGFLLTENGEKVKFCMRKIVTPPSLEDFGRKQKPTISESSREDIKLEVRQGKPLLTACRQAVPPPPLTSLTVAERWLTWCKPALYTRPESPPSLSAPRHRSGRPHQLREAARRTG
ncbi:hypothetical protein J6590_007264 [Homalodisca vitripennis]|nr:hypothetical protein J6590_078154 [Homalodisca vitripennis]KAG8303580.1 hypothetical protein J6590_007264 [Homalodisca vitripennis]